MLDLVIVGAGGFGRELQAMLWDVFPRTEYRMKGFLGRADDTASQLIGAEALLGDPEGYHPQPHDRLLLAIGAMNARVRVVERLEARGGVFATFVHPRSYVAPTAQLGTGAVIYPFAVVSNAVTLGRHVHLNYFASAGHDCQVGDYSLLAPYATLNGFCRLEPEVYLSTHATVVPGRTMGRAAKVSANSAVMRDVPERGFVFGVPGRCVPQFGGEES